MKPSIPFTELPEGAQDFVEQLIETYLDQVGHPPQMSRDEAHAAMLWLLEHGEAQLITHGAVDDPLCEYSIELTTIQ
jgi:hypothetical protein